MLTVGVGWGEGRCMLQIYHLVLVLLGQVQKNATELRLFDKSFVGCPQPSPSSSEAAGLMAGLEPAPDVCLGATWLLLTQMNSFNILYDPSVCKRHCSRYCNDRMVSRVSSNPWDPHNVERGQGRYLNNCYMRKDRIPSMKETNTMGYERSQSQHIAN